MARDRLAYLHLPKAAGTSIRVVFHEQFSDDERCPAHFDPSIFWPADIPAQLTRTVHLGDPGELAAYRYVEGHWSLSTLLVGFDASDIACLLREPCARLLSHYSFWRSWDDEMFERWSPYEAPGAAQLPLSEFLSDPGVAHQTDNMLCRLLLAPHEAIDPSTHIDPADHEELAELAIQQLDALGFVDVVERGDDMRAAIGEWAQIEVPEHRSNVTDLTAGPPIDLADLASRNTLDLLHERTEIDRRLWVHVACQRGWDLHRAQRAASAALASSIARIGAAVAARTAAELDTAEQQLHEYQNARMVRLVTPIWSAKAKAASMVQRLARSRR